MGYFIRNKVPKIIYGKYISPYSDKTGFILNCSTKVLISSLRSKVLAGGGTTGSLKCMSIYLNENVTTSAKSECTAVRLKVRIETDNSVSGDLSCVQNYLNLNFYGDYTIVQATIDTMPVAWENIEYSWDEEWLYFN